MVDKAEGNQRRANAGIYIVATMRAANVREPAVLSMNRASQVLIIMEVVAAVTFKDEKEEPVSVL